MTQALSIPRLFASPPLAGPALSQFRFAPRGQVLAWLQSAADDGNRLELWLGTWTTGEDFSARRMFSGAGEGPEAPSSEAEKARRERLRLFFSGVTEFHWRADGQALRFTLNGVAYPDCA